MRDTIRQIVVAVLAISQVIAVPLTSGGFGEVSTLPSDVEPVYFLAAGFTFAVWGAIIVGCLAYAGYQALPKQRTRAIHRRVGWPLAVLMILFSVWLVFALAAGPVGTPAFRPGFLLGTVIVLFGMLLMAGVAFVRLNKMDTLEQRDGWLVAVPISIYYAWLNVAAIANTTSYLHGIGLRSGGAIWAAVLLVVATLLAAGTVALTPNAASRRAYAAVILWALFGIIIYNLPLSGLVVAVAIGAMVIVAGVTIYREANAPLALPEWTLSS